MHRQTLFPLVLIEMDERRLNRFDRHIVLDQIGLSGQIKFSNSIVTVIGAGGLGSPALLYLAAAGIGEIRIIDDDVVDVVSKPACVSKSSPCFFSTSSMSRY